MFALTILAVTPVLGRASAGAQGVPEGKKTKIKGVVTQRTTDGFVIKDAKFVETSVVLTDSVKVLLDGKPATQHQRTELAKLVGGIIVQVEGYGNASGQLVADKVSISNKDVRSAQAVANKVAPVEERVTSVERRAKRLEAQQEALTAEVAELDELTKIAAAEAERAHERISALDNYTVLERATVTFAVNRALLTPDAKAALDALVAKSVGMKGAAFEITGYTDTTGNAERNRVLSEKRANAVITYLTDTHNIP
jgi:outer membrane protein OmpA-like peptidoglycan-associated protein